jgi:hypothetical protein
MASWKRKPRNSLSGYFWAKSVAATSSLAGSFCEDAALKASYSACVLGCGDLLAGAAAEEVAAVVAPGWADCVGACGSASAIEAERSTAAVLNTFDLFKVVLRF